MGPKCPEIRFFYHFCWILLGMTVHLIFCLPCQIPYLGKFLFSSYGLKWSEICESFYAKVFTEICEGFCYYLENVVFSFCWIQLKMEVHNDYSTPGSNPVSRKILVLKLGQNLGKTGPKWVEYGSLIIVKYFDILFLLHSVLNENSL